MGAFYESTYEEAFIQLLEANGWEYTCGEDLHRKFDETIVEEDLREYLSGKYRDEALSDEELDAIVANLRNTGDTSDYLTLRKVFHLYCGRGAGFTFKRFDGNGTPLVIDYIDFAEPGNNVFRAVNQFTVSYKGGTKERRPDVLLFVNGIPVCIVELKNPADPGATIEDAYDQIHVRYKRDIPHLMKYCALSCISDGSNTRLGTTYSEYVHYYAWKKTENEDPAANKGVPQLETLIRGAYRPDRLLAILRDFVYFPDVSSGREEEIVCRYPQFFATNLLAASIVGHARGHGGDGKGGTYFGATGCGKTYTMLFLARHLALREASLGSPTIVILVDREDLQDQTSKLFVRSAEFLSNGEVREIESRSDLRTELSHRESGGVFICTIQKFSEGAGLINGRSNIVCFSDEAHRSQLGVGSKLEIVDGTKPGKAATAGRGKTGAFVKYGFAKHLRDAFPNASYVGFSGTPIDETIHVFGEIVDRYTMRQAVADGVTVGIKYIPRLARIVLDGGKAKAIEDYYRLCADEGANPEDVAKSKEAMASLEVILGDDGRLDRLVNDIVAHYEAMCGDNPALIQKAMVVCASREIAFRVYEKFRKVRPEWFEARGWHDDGRVTDKEKERLKDVPFINLVGTQGANDRKEMYEAFGDKAHREELAEQFKLEHSNFRIAIVVDMWITGFDVPNLCVMYNDKPLQKQNLIQTISRVNRNYQVSKEVRKEYGLIVDYIGIYENMREAMKKYDGDVDATGSDELKTAGDIFAAELACLQEMMEGCDLADFFGEDALKRLMALQKGAEYVLAMPKEGGAELSFQRRFRGHLRRLKQAYDICHPAGALSKEGIEWAQLFMAIGAFVRKATDSQHDVASMNRHVEKMVREAIACTGVESLLDTEKESELIFSEDFQKRLAEVKLPNTKFQMLLKMMKRAIREYAGVNRLAAKKFDEMLGKIVEEYNNRDDNVFANKVAGEVHEAVMKEIESKVDGLSDHIIELFKALKKDKEKFKALGITFEEKAFYDILVAVRDDNRFEYPDGKCIELAKKIKELIDNTAIYADWRNNSNLRNQLNVDVIDLLYVNGYPPEWHDKVYDRVMEQVDNFKRHQEETDAPVPETEGASAGVEAAAVRVLSGEEVPEALRFVRFLPLYSLKAACGRFGDGEAVEPEGWVEVEGARPDRRMFAVRAAGRSMEPLIRDGDFCVMRAGVEGSREGRIVLAQHRGVADPESGGAYSIKRYRSEKRATSDGSWRHERIVLEPLNRDFDAIVIGEEDADGIHIVAERVEGVRVGDGG